MPEQAQPVVLINAEGKPEQLPLHEAQSLLQKGYKVPLNNAEGNPVSVPYEEAQNLIRAGTHTQPSPQQLKDLIDTAHYNSPSQQALTFIEGALGSNIPGYGKLVTSAGLTTPEDIQNREMHNPGTKAVGEGVGFAAGLALMPESSLPGLISKAGEAAATGIKAEGAFGKIAQLATRSAIEGGLMQAQHDLGEHLLGDPNATAENSIANIGLTAAMSGGLGAAFGGLGVGAGKAVNFAKNSEIAKTLLEKATGSAGKYATKALIDYPLRSMGIPGPLIDVAKDKAMDAFKSLSEKYGSAELAQNAVQGYSHILNMAEKTASQINKHAGAIFASGATSYKDNEKKSEEETQLASEPLKMNKMKDIIEVYMSNPDHLVDHVSGALTPISDSAPNITSAMTQTIGAAMSFLKDKIPPEQQGAAFDSNMRIPNDEIAKFNRYVAVANNPVQTLKYIKNGNLLLQDVETVATIYPAMYNSMKEVLLNNIVNYKTKSNPEPLPYKTVLNMSMFLGEPLVSALKPENLIDNQMALTQIDMQNQAEQNMQRNQMASKSGIGKMKSFDRDRTISEKAALRKSM